jgi:hypothetical protein
LSLFNQSLKKEEVIIIIMELKNSKLSTSLVVNSYDVLNNDTVNNNNTNQNIILSGSQAIYQKIYHLLVIIALVKIFGGVAYILWRQRQKMWKRNEAAAAAAAAAEGGEEGEQQQQQANNI